MKEVTIYSRFSRLSNPRDPSLWSYTIVGKRVTWCMAHYPLWKEDMTVIFEDILEFSDSNSEPVTDDELVIGFDEEIEENSNDGISIYRLNTTERELTIVTKTPPTIIDLRSQNEL